MAVFTQELFEMSRKLTVRLNENEQRELRQRLQSQDQLDAHQHQQMPEGTAAGRPVSWAIGGGTGWGNSGGRSMMEVEEIVGFRSK